MKQPSPTRRQGSQLVEPIVMEEPRTHWLSYGIGPAIRDLRGQRGPEQRETMSQKILAERMTKLGFPFSQVQISQVENRARNRNVTMDELIAFAAALDITPSALLVQAHARVSLDARLCIATDVNLIDWLYSTKPLDGQDPEFFDRYLPTHLLYTSGEAVSLPTVFLQFTLAVAELLRAAERKLDDRMVESIDELKGLLASIRTGDDAEKVRATLMSTLETVNQIKFDPNTLNLRKPRTMTQCTEELDRLLDGLRRSLPRGLPPAP